MPRAVALRDRSSMLMNAATLASWLGALSGFSECDSVSAGSGEITGNAFRIQQIHING